LEREWEEKLAAQQRLEEEHHRVRQQQPRALSAAEREAIRRLAADIPALWAAPTTTDADRKEIIRQVVDRVVVDVAGRSERARVTIAWTGGARATATLTRPVMRWEQMSQYAEVGELARRLVAAGLTAGQIAERLNAAGYRTPKRLQRFTAPLVLALLRRLGVTQPRPGPSGRAGLEAHEWWLRELAHHLAIPEVTLYCWARRGWLRARQQAQAPRRWVVWADAAEQERLRQRHRLPLGHATRRKWTEADQASPALRRRANRDEPAERDQ
jgi:hypothetical protein